ncbi:hypothetical protein GCM10010365_14620 [Streptomyces poonensis]|uniref:Uncharacterized protein n=1 Tax=Streptomyces poonensis TaxID=68255 RepID=A0A918PB40_9ACTN|nr:hypothetical protein GCM10010365_14620 [Streptomyces poonensis]
MRQIESDDLAAVLGQPPHQRGAEHAAAARDHYAGKHVGTSVLVARRRWWFTPWLTTGDDTSGSVGAPAAATRWHMTPAYDHAKSMHVEENCFTLIPFVASCEEAGERRNGAAVGAGGPCNRNDDMELGGE